MNWEIVCEILRSHHVPNGKYSIICNYWKVTQMTSHAIYARRKDALNRKPLGVTCVKFQDFLVLMMSIGSIGFNEICWHGYRALEDLIWNDMNIYIYHIIRRKNGDLYFSMPFWKMWRDRDQHLKYLPCRFSPLENFVGWMVALFIFQLFS